MEPKETKSFQQSQPPNLNQTASKTPKTTRIPDISPLSSSSGNGAEPPPTTLWEGLRLPIKRTLSILVPLLILILVGSGLFNLVRGAIEGLTKKPTTSTQTTEQPITQSSPTTTPTVASSDKNNCTDLPTRMTNAKITAAQVDKLFYQTYPDRVNKPLSVDTITERNLRQEWCSIANKLIEQKSSK